MSAERRTGLLLMVTAAACAAAGIVLASGGDRRATLAELRGYGAFEFVNSRDGEAIFTAPNLAPGHSAAGQVELRNAGTAPGGLRLSQSLTGERPGSGGATVFAELQLQIRDGRGGPGSLVYSGALAAMGTAELQDLATGERRSYEFTVTLPASAPNSVQGSSVSVHYTWTLTRPGSGGTVCPRGRLGSREGERIIGGSKGDRIVGKGGADHVFGRRGRDCLFGGRGDDRLEGGAGGDRLRGGYGVDVLLGGRGNDGVRGRQGNDLIAGGKGRDTLRGGGGSDLIRAVGGGPDKVRCGLGRDTALVDGSDATEGCEAVRLRAPGG